MFGLSIWTAHGKVQVVPDVHRMSVAEAQRVLADCNLMTEVIDSVYDSASLPARVATRPRAHSAW